jgi:hypothetical protein
LVVLAELLMVAAVELWVLMAAEEAEAQMVSKKMEVEVVLRMSEAEAVVLMERLLVGEGVAQAMLGVAVRSLTLCEKKGEESAASSQSGAVVLVLR